MVNDREPNRRSGWDDVPDVFTDAAQVNVGAYGIQLRLSVSEPDGPGRPVAVIRLAPQLAYVMARILLRGLATAGEEGLGYAVPETVLAEAGLEGGDKE